MVTTIPNNFLFKFLSTITFHTGQGPMLWKKKMETNLRKNDVVSTGKVELSALMDLYKMDLQFYVDLISFQKILKCNFC